MGNKSPESEKPECWERNKPGDPVTPIVDIVKFIVAKTEKLAELRQPPHDLNLTEEEHKFSSEE